MLKKDFYPPIPARLFKDRRLSANARLLRGLIGSYADGKSGRTYVKPETLQKDLGWGRRRREQAQNELCRAGWLKLKWKRGARGVWARRIYVACVPALTVAQFERSGKTEQLISYHSQSQVRSSIPTNLTRSEKVSGTFIKG